MRCYLCSPRDQLHKDRETLEPAVAETLQIDGPPFHFFILVLDLDRNNVSIRLDWVI